MVLARGVAGHGLYERDEIGVQFTPARRPGQPL